MNPKRGEIKIELGGEEFFLRPSFEAICTFEDRANLSIFDALDGMNRGSIKLKTLAVALWAGICGYHDHKGTSEKAPSFAYIGSLCQKQGIESVISIAVKFFSTAVCADSDLEKLEKSLGNEIGAETKKTRASSTKK